MSATRCRCSRWPASMPAVIWVLVSVFLSLTAIFFAAMLGTNTEARLRWLLRGYIAAAVVVSLLAIAGYFGCSAAVGCSCCYSRATGTFKDPNVFAAFLVLPGAAHPAAHAGRPPFASSSAACLLLLIVMGGLFLSFSRAAWGQFVLVRDPADGAHLRDQPLAERTLPHCRDGDHGRRGRRRVRCGAVVGRAGRRAVRGARVAVAELRHRRVPDVSAATSSRSR